MSDRALSVLAVVGNVSEDSTTRVVTIHMADLLRAQGCQVDVFDCSSETLPILDARKTFGSPEYPALKERAVRADVFLLGTPDYHGSMSGAMKNFLDHFWTEFAGKLFATVVGSFEKGLTVTDQLRTVARQCYAWSLPYAVAFEDKADVKDGEIVSDYLKNRLEMMVRDIEVYGSLLRNQRNLDLGGSEPGFMAKYRA